MPKIFISLLTAAFLLLATIFNSPLTYPKTELIQQKQNSLTVCELKLLLLLMSDIREEIMKLPHVEQMTFHIDGDRQLLKISLTMDDTINELETKNLSEKISFLALQTFRHTRRQKSL